MLAGLPYHPGDPELQADRARAARWCAGYDGTLALSDSERWALLREGLGEAGDGAVILPPFRCDYGYNLRIGRGAFLNYGCVALDAGLVTVGDGAQIGPGVQLLTADHPRDAAERATGVERGLPVSIGRNVWIGGGAIVLPGVSVGEDAIVGTGAVVTRDVAPGTTVTGNPARVRELGRR